MMRLTLAWGAAVAAAVLGAAADARQSARVPEPHRLLSSIGAFSSAELAKLDRGEPVARVLDTARREVAVVGAIRIAASRDRLLARYRNIPNLRSSDVVLQIGRIGTPPRAEDFQPLEFEAYDLETIRECEPGDCGVRLSTAQLASFRKDVKWEAPDWRGQAAGLWRRLLAEYSAQYLAHGALADYRNKSEPLKVADEFALIFDQARGLASSSPAFFSYLRHFPAVQLAGVENILYWSKDDFGLRPVTSVTHLALYSPPDAAHPAVIGTRQIYATHYFDAALGLTFAFDDGASGFYMVTTQRARTRSLASFARALVRQIVLRRSREGIEQMLRGTKAALERQVASSQ